MVRPPLPAPPPPRPAWRTAIRIVVPIALIALLLWRFDWSQAGARLAGVSLWIVLALFGVMVAELFVSTLKWSYALRMHGLRYPSTFLLRALCSGFFFNSFLPTAVGGDVYRVYKTLPRDGFRFRALSAVLIERAVGLLSLLALGGIGALLIVDRFQVARAYCIAMLGATVLGIAGIVAIERGWLRGLMQGWERWPALDAIRRSLGLLTNRGREWLALSITSVVYQAMSIVVMFYLFAMLSADVSLPKSALITALVGVAAVLPISINGIGVMEGALVAGAVMLGVDYDMAVLVAFLRRFLNISLAAFCGLVHMAAPRDGAETPRLGSHVVSLSQRTLARLIGPRYAEFGAPAAGAVAASPPPDVPLASPPQPSCGARPRFHTELLEYTHDAIIMWEMEGGGIRYFNRAAEQLYGYTRDEAHGRVTHALLKTELTGGIGTLEKKLARYGIWVGELRHTARDGRRIDVDGRLALLAQSNGRWLVLEVNRDVSDRKAAEAARRRMVQQLALLRGRVYG